ncbi:MAG TPA: DUF3592 domain-containing protein [Verrucomicrobiae bacterium]|nr:DUF3592 domain-containing protein [Verrucomicrobiae bacterium]
MGELILILLVLGIGISFGFAIGVSRTMHRVAVRSQRANRSRFNGKWITAFGVAMVMVGLVWGVRTWRFTSIAQRTTGTVIGLLEMNSKDSADKTFAPEFQFQDSSGLFHTNFSNLYAYPPRYKVGETVEILYRNDNPEKAQINRVGELWFTAIFVGGFGAMLTTVGLVTLFWPKITSRFGKPVLSPTAGQRL